MANNINEGAITLVEASAELGKKVAALYIGRPFQGSGKAFAVELLKLGTSSAAMLKGITLLCDRQAKLDTANEAILKLNETRYYANMMVMAGYYTEKDKDATALIAYVDKIIVALGVLLNKANEAQRKVYLNGSIVPDITMINNVAEQESAVADTDGFDEVIYIEK